MAKHVLKPDGTWHEGSASPELLKPELRRLPSEIVTKDEADADKAHELDERHVVRAIEYDHAKAERDAGKEPVKDLAWVTQQMQRAPTDARVPLSQRWVDVEIFHAIRGTLDRYCKQALRGEDFDIDQVYHLWFDDDDARKPKIRIGNPPPDVDRPKHLRGINLVVDPLCPPESIRDTFAAIGSVLSDHRARAEEARALKQDTDSHQAVASALDGYR